MRKGKLDILERQQESTCPVNVIAIIPFFDRKTYYHGSPLQLKMLRSGSMISASPEIAKAFAYKPTNVVVKAFIHYSLGDFSVKLDKQAVTVLVSHNGERNGYLYRVLVNDPDVDVRQHTLSFDKPGFEMVTCRDLVLEMIDELPMKQDYSATYGE